jgi:hypothetical protein
VWFGSVFPLACDVVNARFTFEALTATTANRLHYPAYDRFLKEMDKYAAGSTTWHNCQMLKCIKHNILETFPSGHSSSCKICQLQLELNLLKTNSFCTWRGQQEHKG